MIGRSQLLWCLKPWRLPSEGSDRESPRPIPGNQVFGAATCRASSATLEGPTTKATTVPTVTKPLPRMALKDIKNDPMLGSGPHGPVGPWKGQMKDSEGESTSLQRPKARKGSVRFQDDVRPSGGRNASSDNPSSANRLQRSPKGCPASKTSFFSDPMADVENEGLACAEVTRTNKYFSTPVVCKGRAKQALSPVMEVDMDAMQECSEGGSRPEANVVLKTPLKTPLYRSSFAAECREIVKKIEGLEKDTRSPSKRKAEELEVSCIDSEPPPYDCTPMKSFLAWEVSNMLSSLENSPMSTSVSLFGESLLDLERTDMQDFTFSDLGDKKGDGRSVKDPVVGGIYYSTDREFIKRQKMAPLSFDDADAFHSEPVAKCSTASGTGQSLTPPREEITQMEECGGPSVTGELSCGGPNISGELSCDITGELSCGGPKGELSCDITGELSCGGPNMNVSHMLEGISLHCPEQEDVTKPCASTTQDINEPANATQDIESAPQLLLMLNTTEVMELSPRSVCDVTQEIAVVTKEDGIVNRTIEIKDVPQMSRHTASILNETTTAASRTWVMEDEPPASPATMLDVASLNAKSSLNFTHEMVPQSPANTTRDILSKQEDGVTITPVNAKSSLNAIHEMVLQSAADTTQDILSKREDGVTNTTQVMDVTPQYSPNTTGEVLSVHKSSSSANATQVIELVPDDSGNRTQDIAVVPDEGAEKDIGNTTVNRTPAGTEVTAGIANPANAMMRVCDGDSEDVDFVDDGDIDKMAFSPAVPDRVPKDISAAGSLLSMGSAKKSPEGIEEDIIRSPNVLQTSVPTCDVVNEDRKPPESATDYGNISGCSPLPEKADDIIAEGQMPVCDVTSAEGQMPVCDVTSAEGQMPVCDVSRAEGQMLVCDVSRAEGQMLVCDVSRAEDQMSVCDVSRAEGQMLVCDVSRAEEQMPIGDVTHAEDQMPLCGATHAEEQTPVSSVACAEDHMPLSEGTHVNAGQGTLVSMSTQGKPDGEEASNKAGNDSKDCDFPSPSDASPSKESKGLLLVSQSCSMIQEEESVHDLSVFSVGSLSFVTSTPVPGLMNFQFQKPCKDPGQQDPNVSLGSVLEPPQIKDQTANCMTACSKPFGSALGNEGHKPQSKGLPGLPASVQGSAIPTHMSGIPTARRSLALFNHPKGQSLLSKMPPRGIPGKGTIKPPLARQSLPRASMGNVKQNVEGRVGMMAPSKIGGSSFKTPKFANAKPRSGALPSQLLGAPPSGNMSSQICTPINGTQNVTADLKGPASGAQPISLTGVKSFLPKLGSSAPHPPLPFSSQKTLLKPKSNLPGLPGRKTQFPALGSQKKIVPIKTEGLLVRKQVKPPSSGAPTKEAVSKGAGKPSVPPNRTQQVKAESSGESPNRPHLASEMAEPVCCRHVETCESCQRLIEKLLQEIKTSGDSSCRNDG